MGVYDTVMTMKLTPEQNALTHRPLDHKLFLRGPAGTGKTTIGINRTLALLNWRVPAERILVLVPQRTLGLAYTEALREPSLPPGGQVTVVTLGGLAQRMIGLFWPLIAREAGFAHPEQGPTFLTLETSQYYMARLVQPLIDEGYFESITIDRNRLYSQIVDNLNKTAVTGLDYRSFGERLRAAWLGDPGQLNVYDQAQECANRFRQFCLDNNLLDFSLQMEVFVRRIWPAFMCREYMTRTYRHLIYDNAEEDVPVVHDVIQQWLPAFDSALVIYDDGGGYRAFLGADPESALRLQDECAETAELVESWITPPPMAALADHLGTCLMRQPAEPPTETRLAFRLEHHRFYPEMVDTVCAEVAGLVQEQEIAPGEIVILSAYLSDALRFSIMNGLQARGIPARSHRPSRSLREEPATACLLTLAMLARPEWGLAVSKFDVRNALLQAIEGLDLVRADLMAQILYLPKQPEAPLAAFDKIRMDKQQRITYTIGERYERLRSWLQAARERQIEALDIFIAQLFGELLSQPGFGFHINYDAAAITSRLIESIEKFRRVTAPMLAEEKAAVSQEYLKMVQEGVLAAQYLQPWEQPEQDSVMVSPAYTFLMTNRPATVQFWLDVGSQGWWERLYQPLTHPVVLSRRWTGDGPWTDANEFQVNQETLAKLASGLLRRCRGEVVFCTTGANERGDEERGPLLQGIQALVRRLRILE